MKKIKSNLFIILFFIVLFLFLIVSINFTQFSCTDNIWNFQSIFKMYQGNLIYRDFNVIITPFFFFLGNLMFHVFGANLVTFNMYGVILYFLKFLLLFYLFRNLKAEKFMAMLYTSIWLIVECPCLLNSANYNQLALLFCLGGILWHITNNTSKYYHFVQGFFLFLIFITKQTTGIYYGLGLVLYESIQFRFHKAFFKNQFLKLSAFLPCILVTCFLFYKENNLWNFINLCFGSILEFGSSNCIFMWYNLKYIFIIAIIILFSLFALSQKNTQNEIKHQIIFLLGLSFGMSFNMFPLMNEYHINMTMLFYYILFIYGIDRLLICEILDTDLYKKLSIVISFCILVCVLVRQGMYYSKVYISLEFFDKHHPFYPIGISSENKEKLETISHYIQTKKTNGVQVIVLSSEAATYMVPLKINNGAFDLPFLGNLGYYGIQNMIDKISKMKATEFLIFTSEEDCFYQESKELRTYILNHFEKKR